MFLVPSISSMDFGYPGTIPFASFNSMNLFNSGSIETIVGLPNICDLKIVPYLQKFIHQFQKLKQNQEKGIKLILVEPTVSKHQLIFNFQIIISMT